MVLIVALFGFDGLLVLDCFDCFVIICYVWGYYLRVLIGD